MLGTSKRFHILYEAEPIKPFFVEVSWSPTPKRLFIDSLIYAHKNGIIFQNKSDIAQFPRFRCTGFYQSARKQS